MKKICSIVLAILIATTSNITYKVYASETPIFHFGEKHTITYNLDGGTNDNNPSEFYEGEGDIDLEPATKEGFIFDGWYLDNAFKILIETITDDTDHDVELFAKWSSESVSYTVKHMKEKLDGTFELADEETLSGTPGSEVTPNLKTYEGFTAPSTKTITLPNDDTGVVEYEYSRNSYNLTVVKGKGIDDVTANATYKYEEQVTISVTYLDGYNNVAYTGDFTTASFTMPAKDVTINAAASLISYTITYNLDGGDNNSENPEGYNVEDEDITLLDPTKEGYVFDGWYKENTFENKVDTIVPSEEHKNITLYAKWVEKTYTVTFMVDGTEYDKVENIQKNTTITDFPTNPTKEGKTFKGWFVLIDKTNMVNVDESYVVTCDLVVVASFDEANPAHSLVINHNVNAGLITSKATGVILDSYSDGNNELKGFVNDGPQYTLENTYVQKDGTDTISSISIKCGNENAIDYTSGNKYLLHTASGYSMIDKTSLSEETEGDVIFEINITADELTIRFINIPCDLLITINYIDNTKIEIENSAKLNSNGTINLKYSVSLPKDIDENTSYVIIDGEKVSIKTLDFVEEEYILPLDAVPMKNMNDKKVIQFFDGNNEPITNEITNSVVKYLNGIIDNQTLNQETKDFAKSMLNFGAVSQIYFDYDIDNLANQSREYDNTYIDSITTDEENNGETVDLSSGKVDKLGISLTLRDCISFNLYLTFEDDAVNEYDVYYDGELVEYEDKGGMKNGRKAYCYTSSSASAAVDLDEKHTYTVKDSSGNVVYTYTCSALSYANSIINAYDNDTYRSTKLNVVRLCKMLYDYNTKAELALVK